MQSGKKEEDIVGNGKGEDVLSVEKTSDFVDFCFAEFRGDSNRGVAVCIFVGIWTISVCELFGLGNEFLG